MRDPKGRLRDILEAIARIDQYATQGRAAFEREELKLAPFYPGADKKQRRWSL